MTITNTTRSVTYTGNGSTTAWPYTFNIPDAASANVKTVVIATGIETEISSDDYNISGLGDSGGGSVTYPTSGDPIASTLQLVVYRSVPATQTTTVTNQTAYNAGVVMSVWDRIVMMVQDLTNDAARSLRVPVGESDIADIPSLTQRASKFLAFDASGDPVAGATVDTAVVSTFMETVLDDTTAAAARTTLGAAGDAELVDGVNARTLVITTGAADTYTLTAADTITAYAAGQLFSIRIHAANTGATTLNVDSIGAKDVKKYNASGTLVALVATDLQIGQTHLVGYDGTQFALLSSAIASTSVPGLVEKSTSGENVAGTSDTVYPTVAGVKELMDAKGKILQEVYSQDGAVNTGTTVLPYDNTIPQNTEGDQFLSKAVTPVSASSTLKITVTMFLSGPTGIMSAALFVDSTANALAAAGVYITATDPDTLVFTHFVASGSTTARTYKVRAGGTSGTTTFNGASTTRKYGGVAASSIVIKEIL